MIEYAEILYLAIIKDFYGKDRQVSLRDLLNTMKMLQLLSAKICISSLLLFSASVACAAGESLLAQTDVDPDYEIELQQNTECSFITGDHVNVRSGAGPQYEVVTQLNRGDGVRAQYREGDWVRLAARVYGFTPDEQFEPLDGWVSNQFINGCSEDQFDRWRN